MLHRWGSLVAHVVLGVVVCVLRLTDLAECSTARSLVAWHDAAELAANERLLQGRTRLARARVESGLGRYAPAIKIAQEVATLAIDLEDPGLEAAALLVRGQNEERSGATAEAEATLRRAVERAEIADDRVTRVEALVQLVYLVGDGRHAERQAEALAFAQTASEVLRVSDADPRLRAQLDNNLAVVAKRAGDLEAALEHAERSVAGYERLLGERHPSTLRALVNLGNILRAQKHFVAAEATLRRAADGFAKVLGNDHPLVAVTLSNLAITLAQQDRPQDAIPVFRHSLEIRTRNDPGHPDVAKAHYNLARALFDARALDQALLHYACGLELRRRGGAGPDAIAEHSGGLAQAAAELVRVHGTRALAP